MRIGEQTVDIVEHLQHFDRVGIYLKQDGARIHCMEYGARRTTGGIRHEVSMLWTVHDTSTAWAVPDAFETDRPVVRYGCSANDNWPVVSTPIIRSGRGMTDRFIMVCAEPQGLTGEQRLLEYATPPRLAEDGRLHVGRLRRDYNIESGQPRFDTLAGRSLIDLLYVLNPSATDSRHYTERIFGAGQFPESDPIVQHPLSMDDIASVHSEKLQNDDYFVGLHKNTPLFLRNGSTLAIRSDRTEPGPACALGAHAAARDERIIACHSEDEPFLEMCRHAGRGVVDDVDPATLRQSWEAYDDADVAIIRLTGGHADIVSTVLERNKTACLIIPSSWTGALYADAIMNDRLPHWFQVDHNRNALTGVQGGGLLRSPIKTDELGRAHTMERNVSEQIYGRYW